MRYPVQTTHVLATARMMRAGLHVQPLQTYTHRQFKPLPVQFQALHFSDGPPAGFTQWRAYAGLARHINRSGA